MLETAVQAAVQAMIDCKTIPSESVSTIWSDNGHKKLEPMLRGSVLKFEAVGMQSQFRSSLSCRPLFLNPVSSILASRPTNIPLDLT